MTKQCLVASFANNCYIIGLKFNREFSHRLVLNISLIPRQSATQTL